MINRLKLLATAAALVGLAATASTAEAGVVLRAYNMTPSLILLGGEVFDGGARDDNGTAGRVANSALLLESGAPPEVSTLELSAFGAPDLASPIFAGSVLIKGAVGGKVRVEMSQDDVTVGSTGLQSFFSLFMVGGGSVTMTSYISATNLLMATTTQLATKTFSADGSELFSTPIATGTPYSQTIVFDITLGGAVGTVSQIVMGASIGPYDAQPVPEPASLAVLGAGLLGLGLARRRLRG